MAMLWWLWWWWWKWMRVMVHAVCAQRCTLGRDEVLARRMRNLPIIGSAVVSEHPIKAHHPVVAWGFDPLKREHHDRPGRKCPLDPDTILPPAVVA